MSESQRQSPTSPHGADAPLATLTEQAALYLSGALAANERAAFESRLESGDAATIGEVQRLQRAAEALIDAVLPVAPAAALKDRVMRVLDAEASTNRSESVAGGSTRQIWRRWETDADQPMFTLRADEGPWEDTGVEGVQVRRLFVDRPGNRMTAMFRMAAGSDYPEHVHDGPEECFVLQGDLHVGDEFVMNAGDYQRALPGSEHGRQWTKNGCVLLVTCSLSDEMK